MGLIDAAVARLRLRRYIWSWRLRYWWMDTEAGERARLGSFFVGVLVVLGQLIRLAVAAVLPAAGEPREPAAAVYWWVVQLIIMVVAAAVTYAMRPKVQPPAEQKQESPTVQDGTMARDYGGTVWVEHADTFLLTERIIVGRDPIRTKGGKK